MVGDFRAPKLFTDKSSTWTASIVIIFAYCFDPTIWDYPQKLLVAVENPVERPNNTATHNFWGRYQILGIETSSKNYYNGRSPSRRFICNYWWPTRWRVVTPSWLSGYPNDQLMSRLCDACVQNMFQFTNNRLTNAFILYLKKYSILIFI